MIRQIGVGGSVMTWRERRYVEDVLSSGRLSAGPFTVRFERQFADLHGCRHAIFCNSGTSALHVALAAMKEQYGWSDGDEVLVPALTFVATANIVLHNQMKPVFVDVDPLTYNLDPVDIARHVTAKTRAIIPVHVLGLPCDMASLMEAAHHHGLKVLEDSCETVCARYRGQPVGSFGVAACFSTYMAHTFVTGVGGLVTTNDDDLAVIMKSLFNHGRDSIYLRVGDDATDDPDSKFRIVDRRFAFTRVGYSYRATELEAAIGVAQLERRAEIIGHHQDTARQLTRKLQPWANRLQLPTTPPDRDHVFLAYPIIVQDPTVHRDDLIRYLEERGIETRYLFPLITQPIYVGRYGDLCGQYPVATRLSSRGFYIGCHQEVAPSDVDYVAEQVGQFFAEQ